MRERISHAPELDSGQRAMRCPSCTSLCEGERESGHLGVRMRTYWARSVVVIVAVRERAQCESK